MFADKFNSLKPEQGVVKWFSSDKGYGFIARDSGGDIFVHQKAIKMDGYRSLDQGMRVEYSVSEGRKGLIAENVTPCDRR